MNNQHETVILRGLVRPGDLDATNTVASNSVGDLEVEVKGKGVISEGIRPPEPDHEMDSAHRGLLVAGFIASCVAVRRRSLAEAKS